MTDAPDKGTVLHHLEAINLFKIREKNGRFALTNLLDDWFVVYLDEDDIRLLAKNLIDYVEEHSKHD